ncbi:hypothetical protein SAMN06297144_1607 [Sphingomonas guangdongensis]|uniref:Uncharacterized protein n=1 Tax=Sphingomonas guangdongensis TaxID=1141890 RepID=A0A285QXD1_9SPHN|nr:hypothetical protein SAMN06297144_1607 [Sphingomonas guangdongensis]
MVVGVDGLVRPGTVPVVPVVPVIGSMPGAGVLIGVGVVDGVGDVLGVVVERRRDCGVVRDVVVDGALVAEGTSEVVEGLVVVDWVPGVVVVDGLVGELGVIVCASTGAASASAPPAIRVLIIIRLLAALACAGCREAQWRTRALGSRLSPDEVLCQRLRRERPAHPRRPA